VTTIACDGVSISGDGLVSGDGIIHHQSFEKVRRLPCGAVAGCTGSTYSVEAAFAFLRGEREGIAFGDEFEAIILHPDGRVECMNGDGLRYAQPAPCATGSGAAFALGAMAAGATSGQAVSIACNLNPISGGLVRTLRPTLTPEETLP